MSLGKYDRIQLLLKTWCEYGLASPLCDNIMVSMTEGEIAEALRRFYATGARA